MDIKKARELYNTIPTTPIIRDDRDSREKTPVSQSMIDAVVAKLDKNPMIAPKVG